MRDATRYAIAVRGPNGTTRTVIVHRTDRLGPAHEPVYEDTTGGFRFQINGSTAEVLALPTGYGTARPCLEAVPMP
ncbi:DUF6296 family protein [Kitasatospora sp. NPDC005751]|uniref:DUF6296 family protein n=1 Tax=unclassified Kitasatospora TaxID=2633591 RepID=UPI00340C8ADC